MSNETILEGRRNDVRRMCRENNVAILPFGHAHWLRGRNVDLVVCDLAMLNIGDIRPKPGFDSVSTAGRHG